MRRILAFGSATLRQQFEIEESGVVVGRFRFDTGDGIFSPEQVVEFQQALRDAASPLQLGNWTLALTFEHMGLRHFAAGQTKAALAAFDRLAREFPQESLRQSQLAEALANCGFGALAREHARRAIALAPNHAQSHEWLYLILTRDLLGRQYATGFDWPGARAAIEEAGRLEPSNLNHRWSLAIHLEHGRSGWRYASDAPLAEAADIYEKLSKTIRPGSSAPCWKRSWPAETRSAMPFACLPVRRNPIATLRQSGICNESWPEPGSRCVRINTRRCECRMSPRCSPRRASSSSVMCES
ncbi:MAG: tetratricopeptide repeat protein [Planctomycetaceae bacterium]